MTILIVSIYNMVVFEFDETYTIKKLHLFDKDKNSCDMPAGYGYASAKMLSYVAKAYGAFDYSFTQPLHNGENFVVNYVDYDREKGQRSKNVLGSIVYTPEKTFVVDKLPMERKATYFSVNRAKPGYVMITEYYKKEKQLNSRLEKINY